MIAVGKADVGRKRKRNEDCVFVSNKPIGVLPNLYIVADGMGGHKGGAIASKLAIDAFCAYIEAHQKITIATEEELLILLKRGMMHANHVIYKQSQSNSEWTGMGTTITLCTVINHIAYVAHVGDTRMYCLNAQGIRQMTTDHSLVQEMHDQGYISKSDMQEHPQRHVITRAVGTYEQVKVDTFRHPLEDVEYILLCSDGLTALVEDAKIHQVIYEQQLLENAVSKLIDYANMQGGLDNIAIIIGKQGEVKSEC